MVRNKRKKNSEKKKRSEGKYKDTKRIKNLNIRNKTKMI